MLALVEGMQWWRIQELFVDGAGAAVMEWFLSSPVAPNRHRERYIPKFTRSVNVYLATLCCSSFNPDLRVVMRGCGFKNVHWTKRCSCLVSLCGLGHPRNTGIQELCSTSSRLLAGALAVDLTFAGSAVA